MSEPSDITAINLKRALIRLEQKILISPNPRLTNSSFERTKTSAVGGVETPFSIPNNSSGG